MTAGRTIAITATIANDSFVGQIGKTWWIIAPEGAGQPWDRTIFRSRTDDRTYQHGERVSLKWDDRLDLPAGLYDVALIVHMVGPDGSETHADDLIFGPFRVDEPSTEPWLIRNGEGPGSVRLVGVSTVESDPTHIGQSFRTVTLESRSNGVAHVAVMAAVRATYSGWEDQIWVAAEIYKGPPSEYDLPPDSLTTVRVEVPNPTSSVAQFPNSQPWLFIDSDGQRSDEVMLGSRASFAKRRSSYLRYFAPSGPVEILGLSGPSALSARSIPKITLTLGNMTGSRQVAQAWWYIASLGDATPWKDARASGAPATILLRPWQTAQVVVVGVNAPPRGRWELSAWVHYRKAGDFVHGDGLWSTRTLTSS
jgi:hypothetical protein